MYWLITGIATAALLASYFNFKSILHPHFVLSTIIFVMFFSDFIIRGYEDSVIENIRIDHIYMHQIYILVIMFCIYWVTWVLSPRTIKTRDIQFGVTLSSRQLMYIRVFVWTLLLLELAKRLYFSDWSVSDMLINSFGPRFGRPWLSSAGALGDNKFLFSLIGILLPIAGISFGVLAISPGKRSRLLDLIGYLATLALIVGEGSRTPALLMIVIPSIYAAVSSKFTSKKILIYFCAGLLSFFIASVMLQNRTYGYLDERAKFSEPMYHQDNSYFYALRAFHVASESDERWQTFPFLASSFLNFIPRFFWPGKPALDDSYFGSYKEHYITITFIGEAVALFGVLGGSLVSFFFGVLVFSVLKYFYREVIKPTGIITYLIAAIYIYMTFRSMLNITGYAYPLLFYYTFTIFLKRSRTGCHSYRKTTKTIPQ